MLDIICSPRLLSSFDAAVDSDAFYFGLLGGSNPFLFRLAVC